MKTVTISRNRVKFIESLFARAVNCTCHCLENYFIGAPVSVDVIRRALFSDVVPGKLRHDPATGEYTVRVHSNLSYTFKLAAAETHPACCGCADCDARYAA
jgi:hypothetical protein